MSGYFQIWVLTWRLLRKRLKNFEKDFSLLNLIFILFYFILWHYLKKIKELQKMYSSIYWDMRSISLVHLEGEKESRSKFHARYIQNRKL